MKTNWRYQLIRYRDRFLYHFHTPIFITMMLLFWLLHIVLLGWIQYLFYPKMYVIRVGDIVEDVNNSDSNIWWNRHDCATALKVAEINDPDSLATFTWRVHPFFLDNEYLYVNTQNWKGRVWDDRVKIYHKA